MIASFFLSVLGKPANYLINFYLKYQVFFNLLLLFYGIILAIAYYNLKNIEKLIAKELYGRYPNVDLSNIELEKIDIDWEKVLAGSLFPFITTSVFFTLYRVNKRNVIKVLKKKLMYKL